MLLWAIPSLAVAASTMRDVFVNPIMDQGADPWVVRYDGYYYMTMTTGDNVTIWRSSTLTDMASGEQTVAYNPSTTDFSDIWAPELHHFGLRWYIYVAMDHHSDNKTHRMYVLESANNDPLSTYHLVGEIHDPSNQWAIDGTVLTLHDKLYFIWSGWASVRDQMQRLYIAPMKSPTQIDGARHLLSSPYFSWEKSIAPINEGPEVLQHAGKTFVIYSANASWTNNYCLGMLTFKGGNPLVQSNWIKSPKPVFSSTAFVKGPGHASFTTSENGSQWWIVYHAARYAGSGWDRTIRTQPFMWSKHGIPEFGSPIPLTQSLPLPSGEKQTRITYYPIKQNKVSSTFVVFVSHAGLYGMYVRYENASGTTTMQNLYVNGIPTLPLTFPNLGVQGNVSNLFTTVSLKAGKNILRFMEGPLAAKVLFSQIVEK